MINSPPRCMYTAGEFSFALCSWLFNSCILMHVCGWWVEWRTDTDTAHASDVEASVAATERDGAISRDQCTSRPACADATAWQHHETLLQCKRHQVLGCPVQTKPIPRGRCVGHPVPPRGPLLSTPPANGQRWWTGGVMPSQGPELCCTKGCSVCYLNAESDAAFRLIPSYLESLLLQSCYLSCYAILILLFKFY